MKNIAKLLVIGLLMQHGVAQASWIYEELLGAKQARIVTDARSLKMLDKLPYKINLSTLLKNYEDMYSGANYLKERRDFIKPFGTFGLDYLSLPISEDEEKYKEYIRAKNILNEIFNTNNKIDDSLVNLDRYHPAILQFDLEQRIYQNRVVAGVVLGAVSIAGYLWANKK